MNKSEQTKQGLRKSFESGMSKKASVVCYGYERDKNDSLIINEAEANVVRTIYAGYLKGLSLGKIVDLLLCKGIISPSGKEKWNRETVDKILSNEKYTGSVMLGKSIYEDGKQISTDIADRVIYEHSHPAIIPRELYDIVQMEKQKRSRTNAKSSPNKRKIVEKNR